MPVKNLYAALFKLLRESRFSCVRTGYSETVLQEYSGKAAHADAADSDEMNVDWFGKINLIHIYFPFFIYNRYKQGLDSFCLIYYTIYDKN